MARMKTSTPARKVVAGSLAAAIATLVIWGINSTLMQANPLGANISGAITTTITFLVGYFVPPGFNDQIGLEDDAVVAGAVQ